MKQHILEMRAGKNRNNYGNIWGHPRNKNLILCIKELGTSGENQKYELEKWK